MCGRFTFIDIDEIRERFRAEPIDLKPNYNLYIIECQSFFQEKLSGCGWLRVLWKAVFSRVCWSLIQHIK